MTREMKKYIPPTIQQPMLAKIHNNASLCWAFSFFAFNVHSIAVGYGNCVVLLKWDDTSE